MILKRSFGENTGAMFQGFLRLLQLPITALLQRMPASFQVESLTADVDQDVRDFEARSLEVISPRTPQTIEFAG